MLPKEDDEILMYYTVVNLNDALEFSSLLSRKTLRTSFYFLPFPKSKLSLYKLYQNM